MVSSTICFRFYARLDRHHAPIAAGGCGRTSVEIFTPWFDNTPMFQKSSALLYWHVWIFFYRAQAAPAVVYSFITRRGINEYTTDNRVINEYTTDNRVVNEYTTGHCIKQKSNF